MEQQIVNVNHYRLVGSTDEFERAITALAQRTERDGEPGVLRYQFSLNTDEGTAGAVIVYRDAEAWLTHHRLAYEWDEMAALQATVSLQALTWFGPSNDEIEAMAAGLPITVTRYDHLAAGFTRS